jgi:hypothetical protein
MKRTYKDFAPPSLSKPRKHKKQASVQDLNGGESCRADDAVKKKNRRADQNDMQQYAVSDD